MFAQDFGIGEMIGWRTVLDIGIVAVIIYQLLLLLRGSRSATVMFALAGLFGMFYLSGEGVLDLPTLNWVLDRFLGSIAVVLVILFQDDLKRALAGAIRTPLTFSARDPESSAVLEEVLRACSVLSQRGIGALIVIEQEALLDRYVQEGIRLEGEVSWQVLLSLFIPSHMNPTHDGAVIIQKGRIAAAACFLPLAYGDAIPPSLGSRHRAALGLADETDAIVIVVSEESGRCSVAHMGQLDLELKPSELREQFRLLFDEKRSRSGDWQRHWRRRIVHHTSHHAVRVTGEHDRVGSARITDQHARQVRSTAEHLLDVTRTTGEQRQPVDDPEQARTAPPIFDPTATRIPEALPDGQPRLGRVVPYPANRTGPGEDEPEPAAKEVS